MKPVKQAYVFVSIYLYGGGSSSWKQVQEYIYIHCSRESSF